MKLRTMVKVGGLLFTAWRAWNGVKRQARHNVKSRLRRVERAL